MNKENMLLSTEDSYVYDGVLINETPLPQLKKTFLPGDSRSISRRALCTADVDSTDLEVEKLYPNQYVREEIEFAEKASTNSADLTAPSYDGTVIKTSADELRQSITHISSDSPAMKCRLTDINISNLGWKKSIILHK